MSAPNITDLTVYTDTPLDDVDWLHNWTQTVNWFTDGTADITVNSILAICKAKPLTTTERDALSPSFGWIIANSDTIQLEWYDGQRWQAIL